MGRLIKLTWQIDDWDSKWVEDVDVESKVLRKLDRAVYINPEEVVAIIPAEAEGGCTVLFRRTNYYDAESGVWVGLPADKVVQQLGLM